MKKILLGLIGLLFAVPAVATDLPSGYTELEYIKSTGTQWIDTGIKQQDGDEFGLVYQQITLDASYRNLFGAAVSGQMNEFYISQTSTTTYVGNNSDSNIPHDTNKHTLSWVTTSSSSQNVVVDGQTYVVSVRITPNPDLNVMVFARNASNGKMIGKVYGYYQKRNGEYLINLVPAKNASGGVGMYDTVSGHFFTNAGTGDFIASPEVGIRIATTAYNAARFSPVVTELNDTIATIRNVVTNTINQTKAIADLQATKQTRPDETCPAGKKCLLVEDNDGQPHWYEIIENAYGLPNGYTALEYLQSDGASYLIVPYRVNNKTVFYCRYNEIQNGPQTANAVFGVTTSPDVSKANNGILRLTGSTFDRMGWGNSVEGSIIDVNAPKEFNTWYEVLYDQNKLYQNDRLYATSATQTNVSWVAEYDLGVFARNSASVTMPAIAKISSVWAKENGEYKINLIPARRNSDNVIGMYDTVNDVFYTNQGTGTFVAGPAVQ